ncbi:unnamed protein product [Thlaspi arvense]|uniref:Methyltransferase n=1 Tax=Thlaspi arvense TaxID=13288 RepID=A0AAU9S1V0_THLAR|nr:unnamed protein product [Thlaspi arvense]
MRGRSDGGKKKPVIVLVCVAAVVLVCVYLFFGSSNHGASAIEYGRKLGLGGDDDDTKKDDISSLFAVDEGSNGFTPRSFPVCDDRHSELIPCLDRNLIYQMRLKLDLSLMEHYERHCPPPERRFNCLIPPPPGYKIPIKWPKSRDEVWKVNIPHTHLAHEKSDQNWMVVKGEKINFPGGGTHFHYGADKYIASMANMLNFPNNILNNGGNLRTFLDVGCGVASFGGYLLASEIMTMSLAPNDVHQNQIQFALERGIPAYLGVLGTKRLPYPSRSFELAHCSRCRIDWLQRDGILLLELDRVLRPGGYFAYSSPEAYAQDEEDLRIWREMSALVGRMCWTIAAKRNQTVIWQKPLTNDCYLGREPGTQPPLCNSDSDPDAVYGVNMEACITQYSDRKCEAFSTYPRTYDLLHAWDIISDIKKRGCSAEDLLLEMDRILRPSGFVLIRDKQSVVDLVKKYLKALHWEAVDTKAASDSDQDSDSVILVVQKKLWLTSESLRDLE